MRLRSLRTLGTGAALIELPPETRADQVPALVQRLRLLGRSGVRSVEPDRLMYAVATPNDPELGNLWGLAGPAQGSLAGVNALAAWEVSLGSGATVAIIDTGYRPHGDLAANIVGQYDFVSDPTSANDGGGRDADASDPGDWRSAGQCGSSSSSSSSWHGTHVAGTVSAIGNNGYGIAGVAYGARLVIARVLGKCGGYTSDISDAIVWSSGGTVSGIPANTNPAKVLNLSLGGGYPCTASPELQNAIASARSRNATVVVAAGNSNADASNFSPASCPGVVTVAAVGPGGARAGYSNYGNVVDLAAPGGEMAFGLASGIQSTLNSGSTTPGADSFAFYQGTSMAAPHVAGVAALMYSLDPALTPDAVETILKSSVRSFPASCNGCGTGLVDAAQALGAVIGGTATALANGEPAADLAGAEGSSQLFVLHLPSHATNLSITLAAGQGQAQLYVRRGAVPTTSVHDCLGSDTGNGSACTYAGDVTPGTYYVRVFGVTDYDGYSLLATHGLNPPGSFAFASATPSVGESAGQASVSVTRSGGSRGAVSVRYSTANGTALAGNDYTVKSGTLSWADGDSAPKNILVAISNDTLAESSETIRLSLNTPGNGAVIGTPATATLSIVDNDSDPGVLAFSVASMSVAETTTTLNLSVTRSVGKHGAVSVAYATQNGTAEAGSDYTARSGTLSWTSGDAASKTLSLVLNNDAYAESAENFQVVLSAPTGGASLGVNRTLTVSIADNDSGAGTLAFSSAAFSAQENAGFATITVTRSGGSGGAVSLNYATITGTAGSGSDYTAVSGTLSWGAADPLPKTFVVPILDDGTWEPGETVALLLSAPGGGAVLGTQKTATLTVLDNDNTPGTLSLSAANYSVTEGSATLTVTATRTGGNAGAVSVAYATVDGSAIAGSDYSARSGLLSWANGDSASKTVAISITNDLYAESAESFGIALGALTGGAAMGGLSSATIALNDNDGSPGALAFGSASLSVTESGATALVTVTRTGGSGGAVSVSYATGTGTATAGADYTPVSGTLSWSAADPLPKTFVIPIADDTTWESNETFPVLLSTPAGGATLGAVKSATVSITDNDNTPGVITLSSASHAVTEGTTTVTLVATRSGGNAGAVSVGFATANGSAAAGGDYTARNGTLSWANGDSASKSFAITVANDAYAEASETFSVTLSAPTGGASAGTIMSATVTIQDNDGAPGTLAFSTSGSSVAENAGMAVITVTRTGGSGGGVSVDYAVSGGTASAGVDYTPVSGTLSWGEADPLAKTFTVPILDDTDWESGDTIVITLANPGGGALLGSIRTTSLGITDNDNTPGRFEFSANSYAVTEGTASVTIQVRRVGGNLGAVGVSYFTRNGSAVSGSDYKGRSASLSWASGDSASKIFGLSIANDSLVEALESFGIGLRSPSGGALLGNIPAANVAITDNDG